MSVLSVLMLVSGSIALSGCGRRSASNPTSISYSEVGICKSYSSLTGTEHKAKPDEVFAVFKIETIDNSKQSSDFNLDPARFYVDQTEAAMKAKNISFQTRRFMNANLGFAEGLGVKPLARAAFPANQKTDVNSFIVVPLVIIKPTGEPEANPYSFDLVYDTTTTEQQIGSGDIVLTKTNPADTKYTVIESCKALPLK
jgi:hypothetical protein